MIYFTKDTTLPPFVPLPRFIIQGEYTVNAKLLYGLILNRTLLSRKSGWYAENGAVYVIYTIKQMANDLNRSERTVKTALNELENAGLIQRVRQGWNRANRIFLKLPDMVRISSPPEGDNCPLDGQDSAHCIGQILPTSNNNQENNRISKTDSSEEAHLFGEFQKCFSYRFSVCRFARFVPWNRSCLYREIIAVYGIHRKKLSQSLRNYKKLDCTGFSEKSSQQI